MQPRLVVSQRKGKQTLFRVGYSLPEELASVSNCAIIHDTVIMHIILCLYHCFYLVWSHQGSWICYY